jgi:hypothetical protein
MSAWNSYFASHGMTIGFQQAGDNSPYADVIVVRQRHEINATTVQLMD